MYLRYLCFLSLVIGVSTMLQAQQYPPASELPAIAAPPNLLVMQNGTEVTSADQWFKERRPELRKLIEHYMYGAPPVATEQVTATLVRTNDKAFDGKGIVQEITLTFGPEQKGKIHVLLAYPHNAKQAPLFLGLNFNGNHSVLADPEIALPTAWMRDSKPGVVNNRATEAGRGSDAESWCADLLVSRGYALATAYYGDIDPDKDDFTDGVHALYYKPGQTHPEPQEWGSVAAWSWGLSRMMDYLQTRPEIHAERMAVIGHSRLGKTALLTGALDERVAIVCPHQSGTGGCALSRDNNQETVERINRVFPHWFCGNFKQFGSNETKIPFDQHAVMALCAPRPIFDSEGSLDKWANYDNSFRSLQEADKLYKFLGKTGLKENRPLEENEKFSAENCGELIQYRRDAKHAMTRDYWQRVLDFADFWYAKK
jgi:hypothetical protein